LKVGAGFRSSTEGLLTPIESVRENRRLRYSCGATGNNKGNRWFHAYEVRETPMRALNLLKLLYVQVVIAAVAGVVVGLVWPETGEAMRPLGDAFIRVIKMIIAPVVFCTVAIGIAHMSDLKKFGRVGGKTLLYFEVVSTLALAIGLLVGN